MMPSRNWAWIKCAVLALLGLLGCCNPKTEIVVFYASSLSAVLGDMAKAYELLHPKVRIRLEPSGSQVACRKVTELGMTPDLVAVADAELINSMLIPTHARFSLVIATNEIVIAHKDHSPHTDRINADNWPQVLTGGDVRLGRADPNTAPIGYHTLMVWRLAERFLGNQVPDLTNRLLSATVKARVAVDEAELWALLEGRAIDYAFLYRSTAEDHRLKILTLPPAINLSRLDLTADYGKVSVPVTMKTGDEQRHKVGGAVTIGATLMAKAPHAEVAAGFLAFWLSEAGGKHWARRGFHRLKPSLCSPCTDIPAEVAMLISRKPRE